MQSFYETVFGWEFQSFGEDYLAFKSGICEGGFYRSELQARQENGSLLAVLQTDMLDALALAVVEHGGKIVKSIFQFPGGRRFQFLDPHGNELGVWSNKDRNGTLIR